MPGHLPPRPRHGKLHGAQPLPRSPPQQLQLRRAQVQEGGEDLKTIFKHAIEIIMPKCCANACPHSFSPSIEQSHTVSQGNYSGARKEREFVIRTTG